MSRKEFSIADGIAVQQEQLRMYKVILNESTYTWLVGQCERENNGLVEGIDDGYCVLRGTDIQNMLFNHGSKKLSEYDR